MKKTSILIFTFVGFLFNLIFSSCGGSAKDEEISRLQVLIDSLDQENTKVNRDINDLTCFIETLADGLDSIAKRQDMLFYSDKGKEGLLVNREQLRKNLLDFEKMLVDQKRLINHLVDSLSARGLSIKKMNTLIDYLNSQIDDKNKMISQLKSDLEKKNFSISQLQTQVSTLTTTNKKLSERVEMQNNALAAQDEIINEGYVKIGTKKELKQGGFISKKFFGKTKLKYDNIDVSKFIRVDIRNFTEITIKSNNPKIITPMPKSSYTFNVRSESNQTTLIINDPATFWSVCNFLIIQTD